MLLKYKYIYPLLASTVIFSACSNKTTINNYEIEKLSKYNPNVNIKNSKAMHRATLRPYRVFGVKYYPFIPEIGEEFTGIASWYGPKFHAKKTSNGEIYNMHDMTAAHKTLPMNTMVQVHNLVNGKKIIVRINDRGPFVRGRIIDLSNKAAHKIDMVKSGTVKVRIKVLGFNGQLNNYNAPDVHVINNTIKKSMDEKNVVLKGNYSLQVGAFSRYEGAKQTKSKYESMFSKNVIIKEIHTNGKKLFKVYLIGFNSYNNAMSFKDNNGLSNAIISEE